MNDIFVQSTKEGKEINDSAEFAVKLQNRLHTLVDYWIEHNREHEQEFREWADKAVPLYGEVAQQLQEAATKMADASNCLEKARQALVKKPS
jgi:hypothetical protein